MIPSCTALIGYLCVFAGLGAESGPQTSIVITTGSLYRQAEVRSLAWKAAFVLSGDVMGPVYYRPDAVHEACNNGICVKYHRKCDNADRPMICDYRFVSPFIRSEIHVEATSPAAFVTASRSLHVLANLDGATVSFSILDREGALPDPYCQMAQGRPLEQSCIEVRY